jgi:hypothetical protein
MTHPLLHLLLVKPGLLADHAEAYLALFNEELETLLAGFRRKAWMHAAIVSCLVLTYGLAGVALMLGALFPERSAPAMGVLIGIPLLPLSGAIVLVFMLRPSREKRAFETLTLQFKTDVSLLRSAGTP